MLTSQKERYIFQAVLWYAICATLWILLSDRLLGNIADISRAVEFSIAKGLLFVIISSVVFFMAMHAMPDDPTSDPYAIEKLCFLSSSPNRWLYLVTIGSSVTMLLIRHHIAVAFDDRPLLLLFVSPIILSAIFGGLWHGLLATSICAIGTLYFTVPPIVKLHAEKNYDLLQLFFLVANGVAISVFSEVLHRSLRRSRALYQLNAVTLSSVGDAVIITDKTGAITFVNPEAERLLGVPSKSLIAMPLDEVFELVNEYSKEKTLLPNHETMALTGTVHLTQHTLITKDKKQVPVAGSIAPINFPVKFSSNQEEHDVMGAIFILHNMTTQRISERKLIKQAQMLEDMSAMAHIGGWSFDVATGSGGWTREVARIHEVEETEAISAEYGVTFFEGEFRDALEDAIHDAITLGKPYDLELQMVTAKGRLKWVRTVGHPVKDGDKIVRMEGYLQDITAKKEGEILYKQSQENVRMLVTMLGISSQPIAQLFVDGRIGFYNQALLELIGYTGKEIQHLRWMSDLIPPELIDYEVEKLQQLYETGRSIRYESECIRKDGRRVPIELLVHIIRDEEGEPLYYFTFITDITERKKALKLLAASEQKYRQLHESMRDAFVLVDMNGKIIDCNTLYVDMLGYPQETLMGLTYNELTPERWHQFEMDIIKNQIIPRGYSEVYEKEYQRADGSIFPVELKTFLVRDNDGMPSGMWAIVRDITQRKKELDELNQHRERLAVVVRERTADLTKAQQDLMVAFSELEMKNQKLLEQNEKLAKLDRMKSMFIATMSHEFRTPLNSIIGFSSILKDEWLGNLNPEQKQEIDCILRSGKHLLGLINDVIDISKIEAGTLSAQVSDFMLQKVIKEILIVLEPKASAKGLNLEMSQVDTELHTDESRLYQVILNLMDNAIKFTDAGTVSLESPRLMTALKYA